MATSRHDLRQARRAILHTAMEHVVYGDAAEMLVCTCGWRGDALCWHDDAVLSDLPHRPEAAPCILIGGTRSPQDMASVEGIVVITGPYKWTKVPAWDLEWLAGEASGAEVPAVLRSAARQQLAGTL
jgi:hypothetical protein